MGWLSGRKARRLALAAQERCTEAGPAQAFQLLEGDEAPAEAWARFALWLKSEELVDEARRAIMRALELEPRRGDALIVLAELERDAGDLDAAIAAYERLLTAYPQAARQGFELAELLVDNERIEEALRVLDRFPWQSSFDTVLLRGRALFGAEQFEAAVDVLSPLPRAIRNEMQSTYVREAFRELQRLADEVDRVLAEATAAAYGREAVVEVAANARLLDARAAANFTLLGEARMVGALPFKASVELLDVAATHRFGEDLIARGERARGLCHLAVARLRSCELDRARRLFEEARDLDDALFAPYLGLGAVINLEQHGSLDRLRGASSDDSPELPAGGAELIVDWEALTTLERHAVAVALRPLARLIPGAVASGARVRVLPIDARLTDLPQFAEGGERRLEDHRIIEAVTGAATVGVAASKIEHLLDVGDASWTFAHELAHILHFHAPDPVADRIEELWTRAMEHEHVLTAYQQENELEFFAVGYNDYLAHKLGLPDARELDDEGITEELFELFDQLGDH